MAGPLGATRDIDVVVAGNLLAHRNVATCHKEGAVALVEHISTGIAAVIYVPIWRAEQNDLAIGVVAMIGSLAEFFLQW
jgi:hypothetical protein